MTSPKVAPQRKRKDERVAVPLDEDEKQLVDRFAQQTKRTLGNALRYLALKQLEQENAPA